MGAASIEKATLPVNEFYLFQIFVGAIFMTMARIILFLPLILVWWPRLVPVNGD
jgi:hypothetical protein